MVLHRRQPGALANTTHRGKFWNPGFDPVTQAAAAYAFRVALVVVLAVADGRMPAGL